MNNKKEVFKQIMANPKVEICAMIGGKWFRMTGTLVRDDRFEARAEFLKQTPISMYKPDDGLYEVFLFLGGPRHDRILRRTERDILNDAE